MNNKLYVGNLDYSLSSGDLKAAFADWDVSDCKVIESKGFAFVTFTKPGDATSAKEELSNKELKGRPMKIDFAQENYSKNRNNERSNNDYQRRY